MSVRNPRLFIRFRANDRSIRCAVVARFRARVLISRRALRHAGRRVRGWRGRRISRAGRRVRAFFVRRVFNARACVWRIRRALRGRAGRRVANAGRVLLSFSLFAHRVFRCAIRGLFGRRAGCAGRRVFRRALRRRAEAERRAALNEAKLHLAVA